MMYVASMNAIMRGHLLHFPRLYAFPSQHEGMHDAKFIMLDSGAFSLSLQGKEIDEKYIIRLLGFYKKHGGSNKFPIIAVAPDVFLNPHKTMYNYKFYCNRSDNFPAPVIQFERKKKLDLFTVMKQCKFYKNYNPSFLCISNPSLEAGESFLMHKIIEIVRNELNPDWIHILGAGWSGDDVRRWSYFDCDSIDSIAFYTDAIAKKRWRQNSAETDFSGDDVIEIAKHNINTAQLILDERKI